MKRMRLWAFLSALALAFVVAPVQGADFSAWGDNGDGQLGDNVGLASQATPVPVLGLTNVIAIGAGGQAGYAVP